MVTTEQTRYERIALAHSRDPADLAAQVADELNVHELDTLAAVPEGLVDYTVKPNYRALGRRFGRGTPAVAAAIEAADAAGLAAELRSGGQASVIADGAGVSLEPEDVIVTQVPRSGWAVASGGGEAVATALTQLTGVDVPLLGQIPLDVRLREGGDSGNPLVLADPSAPAAIQLTNVAESLASKGRGLAGRMLSLSPR